MFQQARYLPSERSAAHFRIHRDASQVLSFPCRTRHRPEVGPPRKSKHPSKAARCGQIVASGLESAGHLRTSNRTGLKSA